MLQVAMRLLTGGCKTRSRNSHGETPYEVAACSQWLALSTLIMYWDDLKVCQVVHHTLVKKPYPDHEVAKASANYMF